MIPNTSKNMKPVKVWDKLPLTCPVSKYKYLYIKEQRWHTKIHRNQRTYDLRCEQSNDIKSVLRKLTPVSVETIESVNVTWSTGGK